MKKAAPKRVSRVKQKGPLFPKKSSFLIVLIIAVMALSLFSIYKSYIEPDAQCLAAHTPTSTAPKQLKSANDFFLQGDFDYESGNCKSAVEDYGNAIKLNPKYAEAYNNRAYTHMRMGNYAEALTDLDRAIKLKPDYAHALMNRGDIYNYYYNIDRQKALADYDKVLSLGPEVYGKTSLCGHRLLAKNNGWNLNVFYTILTKGTKAGCE